MKRVCAWCKEPQPALPGDAEGVEGVSHTLCPRCRVCYFPKSLAGSGPEAGQAGAWISAGPEAAEVAAEAAAEPKARCGECGGESADGEPVCVVCAEAADGRRRSDGRLICVACLAEDESAERARQ